MVSESRDDSTPNPSAPALVTRRQLREAESLARSPRAVRRSNAAGPVPAITDRPSRRRAAPAAATASKRSSNRVWQTAVTVLVVPGLFATAALPAYAASTDENGETVAAAAPMLGQSFSVGATTVAAVDRGGVVPTSDAEMALRRADPGRQARVEAYDASGARQLGDDYPWPYEKADVEGGGLSPLNYYYRECVDFVAWRLNRDAGSTSAPWKYTWKDLTPNGGNASMWASNWRAHGWATGKDPVPGSVAWFAGNHVAYVKAVTADGDVVIEEYNHGSTHKYGIRTIPASQVALFLYAPPR